MRERLEAIRGGFRAEISQLLRSRLFVILTIVQAITFLFLVSLFGLTGSRAPTAIILDDKGPYARKFVDTLEAAHHSFDLRVMDRASALAALRHGDLVAMITIPTDFSTSLMQGKETTIQVQVDNVNTDMTDDIKRALPSAIVAFGRDLHLSGIHAQISEQDLIDHDTGFIPYLVVSSLALDAFVIACILSAMAVAREFESGTIRLLAIAPVHPLFSLLGRVLATDIVATIAMILPVAIAVFGYQITPLYPLEMIGVILLSIAIFCCIGVALGALLKRTLPVVSLVFGLGLPLYLCSGSLEPQRFDGNIIWFIAHISPVYYSVGILEQAFHGLQVTPESVPLNFAILLGWAVGTLLLASVVLRRATREKSATHLQKEVESGRTPRLTSRWLRRPVLVGRNWSYMFYAVPLLFLLIGGLWLNLQRGRLADISTQQGQTTLMIASGRQQDALLASYIEKISTMITRDDLLHARENSETKIVADVLTLETLFQLDAGRKTTLLLFLHDTKLIDEDYHVISLKGADLHGASFAEMNLSDTYLMGANFSGSDLHGTDLGSARLIGANFSGANLAGADLSETDLHNVDFNNAELAGTNLQGATGISAAQLMKAHSLIGAILPDGLLQPGQNIAIDGH